MKEARELIKAWESLDEGHYTPRKIQKWLVDVMKPSIDHLREALASNKTKRQE